MKKYIRITGIAFGVLFILSWITPFCNLYSNTIYALISNGLGVVMGVLPVNVGECLMYLMALGALTALVLSLLLIFLRKKEKFRRFTLRYLMTAACVVMTFLLIYMLNWWIPFRSSLMGGALEPVYDYSLDEIEALRNIMTEKTNKLSEEVQRDEEGKLIYTDKEKVREEVSDSMKKLSDEYARLGGYYPPAKEAYCSSVLRWMYIGGYTYPYSMEITCNRYVNRLYYPALFAHESSHHQGYYRENEANFFEYLGCNGCEDPMIRYSACIEMYYYLNDAYLILLEEADPEHTEERYKSQIQLSGQVKKDEKDARATAEALYNESSHPLESLKKTASKIADKGWSTQSEIIGDEGYQGVVPLLVAYYRQKPEAF